MGIGGHMVTGEFIPRHEISLRVEETFAYVLLGGGGRTGVTGSLNTLVSDCPYVIVNRAEPPRRVGSVKLMTDATILLPVDFQPTTDQLFLIGAILRRRCWRGG
jgi:hypothetical protein